MRPTQTNSASPSEGETNLVYGNDIEFTEMCNKVQFLLIISSHECVLVFEDKTYSKLNKPIFGESEKFSVMR